MNSNKRNSMEKELDEILQIYLPDDYYEDLRGKVLQHLVKYIEDKAKVFSSNAVLKVTKGLPKENKKEKPEVAVCLHKWIDYEYYDECERCWRRR